MTLSNPFRRWGVSLFACLELGRRRRLRRRRLFNSAGQPLAGQVESLEPRQLLAGVPVGPPAPDIIAVKSLSVSANMAPQNHLVSNITYSVTETAGPGSAANLNDNPGAGQFGYSVDSNGEFTWDVSPSQATGDYTFKETVSGDSGYSSSGTYSRSFTVGVKSVGFDNFGNLVVVGPANADSNISI